MRRRGFLTDGPYPDTTHGGISDWVVCSTPFGSSRLATIPFRVIDEGWRLNW